MIVVAAIAFFATFIAVAGPAAFAFGLITKRCSSFPAS
jgi:hypothetical protein